MTSRLLAALRETLQRWDRFTVLQLNAPLTHDLIRGTR
jgi:hypothetical protein